MEKATLDRMKQLVEGSAGSELSTFLKATQTFFRMVEKEGPGLVQQLKAKTGVSAPIDLETVESLLTWAERHKFHVHP
jgi:hypothetical protein